MNDESGYRFMHRAKILGTAIEFASDDLSKIEGAANDLIGRQTWDKEKDLFLANDIRTWAIRTRAYLSEAYK